MAAQAKKVTHYVCSNGHMWSAVNPSTQCPHCIDGKPCKGLPRITR